MSTSNLKISIATLSLCVSAVAIYIHLPYVIAAVSGSGAIEAVPLAIFAVSAIVALVSVICLIRLAVSRAGDKKKIDLSGEESGHTASQEPQKLVHGNSTNLESKPIEKESDKSVKQGSGSHIEVDSGTSLQDKSSVPTSPLQSSQTRDATVPHVPQEKPVKQDSGSQIKVNSGTSSQDKSSVPTSPSQSSQTCDTASSQVPHSVLPSPPSLSSGAVPPPPPPPSGAAGKKPPVNAASKSSSPKAVPQNNNAPPPPPPPSAAPPPPPAPSSNGTSLSARDDLLEKIKQGIKFMSKEERDKVEEKRLKRLENKNKLIGKESVNKEQVQPTIANLSAVDGLFASVMSTRRIAMSPPESVSDHSGSWDENGHEQEKPKQKEKEQTKHTNSPSSKEEGSGGLDSGIGSRATSPLYSEQKIEEPPSSCVDSPSTAQVNNVNPVNNEVQDPSTLPLKDRITKFGGEALQCQKQFVVQRS